MAEYIEREAAIQKMRELKRYAWAHPNRAEYRTTLDVDDVLFGLHYLPAADVVEVVHGRWVLTVHSLYRDTFDESCELCVYIVANCSECSGKHPNSYQVYSKTLYAPEDADNGFRFNQKAEEEKALLEFKQRKVEYANYCPNCGCRMDKDGE